MLVEIMLEGCEGETVFTMQVTEQEYKFLQRLAKRVTEESRHTCMPRMYVEVGGEGTINRI